MEQIDFGRNGVPFLFCPYTLPKNHTLRDCAQKEFIVSNLFSVLI